jgi:hypothetical protein
MRGLSRLHLRRMSGRCFMLHASSLHKDSLFCTSAIGFCQPHTQRSKSSKLHQTENPLITHLFLRTSIDLLWTCCYKWRNVLLLQMAKCCHKWRSIDLIGRSCPLDPSPCFGRAKLMPRRTKTDEQTYMYGNMADVYAGIGSVPSFWARLASRLHHIWLPYNAQVKCTHPPRVSNETDEDLVPRWRRKPRDMPGIGQ